MLQLHEHQQDDQVLRQHTDKTHYWLTDVATAMKTPDLAVNIMQKHVNYMTIIDNYLLTIKQ